jgi:signal transduction histidine kinase
MQVQREPAQNMPLNQDEIIQQLQQQVTRLTAANAELRAQLEQKEQFTAMIIHEMRNPLAPIMNYARLLSRHTCTPDEKTVAPDKTGRSGRGIRGGRADSVQRGSGIIMGQAQRLSRLINDLLDSNRLSTNRFSLIRSKCNLNTLIQEVVESIRPVAPYHMFDVLLPDEPVTGQWDNERLQQVIGNLLDNATKYSEEHTTITIRVWTDADRVHVSVHNQGSSIPPADLEQLFQPYSRLKAAGDRSGLGLGLYIARSIIEAHGGTLRLEPHADTEDRGTTFAFDLPL